MKYSYNSLPQLSPAKALASPVGYNPLHSFNASTPVRLTSRLPALQEATRSAQSISLRDSHPSQWAQQKTPDFQPAQLQQALATTQRGLKNLGNTSFLSAVLQCLLRAPHFAEFFCDRDKVKSQLSFKNKLKWRLALHLHRLIQELTQASEPVSPAMINNVMRLIAPQFATRQPVDCANFLRSFLDALHQDLNRVRKAPPRPELKTSFRFGVSNVADEWWEYSLQCENSKITDIFQGQVVTLSTCTNCKQKQISCEPFLDLKLPVPEGHVFPKPMLEDCLRNSMKERVILQQRCTHCKKLGRIREESTLHRLPPVLIIQLDRFKAVSLNQRTKVSTNVAIPQELDLTRFVSYSDTHTHYRLFGTVHHRGSWEFGHYVAKCLDGDNWQLYDDSKVFSTEPPSGSSTPYLLFYSQYEPEASDESFSQVLD